MRRPSDGVTSDALPIEYVPLDSGRRSLIALRKGLKVTGNYEQLNRLLSLDDRILEKRAATNGPIDSAINEQTNSINEPIKSRKIENTLNEVKTVENMDVVDSNEKTTEWLEKTQFDIVIEETPSVTSMVTSSPQSMSFECDTKTISPAVSRIEDEKTLTARSDASNEEDKTLNELLEQVAELDEIYSGYQIKRPFGTDAFGEVKLGNDISFDETFDDAATYTSLQRAFKNPVPISDPKIATFASFDTDIDDKYDTVEPINIMAPIIDISPLKRNDKNVEEEKLPPLPPKRLRKITAENTEYNANLIPTPTITPSATPTKQPNDASTQIIIKRTPDQLSLKPRSPASSTPNSTHSSPQKKQGFFSRIFRRKSKGEISSNCTTETRNSPNLSRESSFNNFEGFDRNRLSTRSFKQPTSPSKKSKPVGRSVSSVSGKRPHLTADIVHIPLKGLSSESWAMRSGSGNLMPEQYSSHVTLSNNLDRKTVSALQLADIPLQEGNMELIAIADAQSLKNLCEGKYGVTLDADVDLGEAEHFAVYTVAPHATQSEFDEMSAFYAPVEAAEVVPNSEIAKRLALSGSGRIDKEQE